MHPQLGSAACLRRSSARAMASSALVASSYVFTAAGATPFLYCSMVILDPLATLLLWDFSAGSSFLQVDECRTFVQHTMPCHRCCMYTSCILARNALQRSEAVSLFNTLPCTVINALPESDVCCINALPCLVVNAMQRSDVVAHNALPYLYLLEVAAVCTF